jgi:hypothetical protein
MQNQFFYNPASIPTHDTPLYDHKHARYVPALPTVRVGHKYYTPKQIVFLLHNPESALPRYLLNLDGNPNNIRIENLCPSDKSRRWDRNYNPAVDRDTGKDVLIPEHLRAQMTPEDMERLGLSDRG